MVDSKELGMQLYPFNMNLRPLGSIKTSYKVFDNHKTLKILKNKYGYSSKT